MMASLRSFCTSTSSSSANILACTAAADNPAAAALRVHAAEIGASSSARTSILKIISQGTVKELLSSMDLAKAKVGKYPSLLYKEIN